MKWRYFSITLIYQPREYEWPIMLRWILTLRSEYCVNMYIHICIHVHKHVYVNLYIYMFVCMYLYAHILLSVDVPIPHPVLLFEIGEQAERTH